MQRLNLARYALLIISIGVVSIRATENQQFFHKKRYECSAEPIDVVMVCHPKDARTLPLAIAGIREHGKNIRRVIVVSSKKITDEAEWFNEKLYPFSKYDLALEIFDGNRKRADKYVTSPKSRIGWIYQQLLKLYAPFIIPGISSNVLIVDADTIFLNPTEFIDEQGHALYNPGFEYNKPYFDHGARLIPGFKKLFEGYSGVSHHMLFQRAILEDFFETIEAIHGIEPWRAICRCIKHKHLEGSALSEYELYFNFAFAKTDQVKIRPLSWANIAFNKSALYAYHKDGYHYVSCHSWIG